MTAELWLPGAHVVDLRHSRGNGPFTSSHNFLGTILHVNESKSGTSDGFFEGGTSVNPNSVTPTFEVYNDGTIHQYLPFDWQPWCQIEGNFHYGAIETAGTHDQPLTNAQLAAIAKICAAYHTQMGMPLTLANSPGQRGLGTHAMGGAAWGGHPCPGTIRTAQRSTILSMASKLLGGSSTPPPNVGPYYHRPWPSYMPANNWFGNVYGPAQSHGGYYEKEQPDVVAIQARLGYLGFSCAGDPSGKIEAHTIAAITAFQKRYLPYPQTTLFGELWESDWSHLFSIVR